VGVYLKLSSPSGSIIVVLLFGVFALSAASAYYVHIKPVRDLESAVVVLLDCVGQRIIDAADSDRIEARLNYLAIFRPARWLFCRRFFRIAWGLGMKYEPDNTVQFHVSKGVAGRALQDRKKTLVNLELPQNRNFGGFSDKEKATFPLLTAIWSVPIFELDRSGNATGKILGTINLDSETLGAWHVFSGNEEYEGLLEELQDLVSKVASC
jgi:hypothetical protein